MARIIKYYAENGVTVIEEGLDSVIIRPSFSYNDVSDIVTIINLDNQAQDWSDESSVFRKKDGSSIGSTKAQIVTYLSENTVFSKGASAPDPSWGSIVGTLSDQTDLQSALDSKQDELVSGTNIKTVNNTSILGSGNIETASVNPTSGILPVNENGVFVDSVVSENSGNIGIGTTAPSTELHVVGAITVNDGNNNTKVGTNAGLSFTGINQSAFGYNAGLSSSGDNQTVVGYQAGQSNTATSQSAFGRDSGRLNTGINQSAFGRESGSNNSGVNQSVLGSLAGFSNTGDNQTAVGRESGRQNTGDNNSNFGFQAGYYLSNGSTVNTASSDSLFLGSNTKALGASQTNQIVIGHDATGIGANSVTLGNDSIVTTALKGNVGIGTTSPSEKLDVSGNIKLSETAATTDTDKFVVLDSGVLKYRTGSQLLSDIGASVNPTSGIYPINYNGNLVNSGLQNTFDSLPVEVEYAGLKFVENAAFGGDEILNLNGASQSFSLGLASADFGNENATVGFAANFGNVIIGCGVSSPFVGVFKASGDGGFIRIGSDDSASIGIDMFQNGFRVGSNLMYDQGGNKRIRVFDEGGTEYYITLHTI